MALQLVHRVVDPLAECDPIKLVQDGAMEARAKEREALEQAEYDAKMQERAEKERQTGRVPRGRAPKPPTPAAMKTIPSAINATSLKRVARRR